MRNLIARIRRKLRASGPLDESPQSLETASTEGLPFLPAKRRHELTPSPSRRTSLSNCIIEDTFFGRLPAELRNQIYHAAFGDRTLHIELQCSDKLLAPGPRTALDHVSQIPVEMNTRPGWHWWSCVCHRRPRIEHFYDDCRRGATWTPCPHCSRETAGKCFLGVMGWLLTCRRAYLETINLLYSSNTIHIAESSILLLLAPRLLLPHRIATITSLEITLDLPDVYSFSRRSFVEHMPVEQGQRSHLDSIVASFPLNFCSLKKLDLAVKSKPYNGHASDSYLKYYERAVLEPLDDMVKAFSLNLEHCVIAIFPKLVLDLMAKAERTVTFKKRLDVCPPRWRFWRPVHVTGQAGTETESGYWIRQGLETGPISYVSCFGT